MSDPTRQTLRELDGHSGQPCRIHTVTFEGPREALSAARRLRKEGYLIADVHSPFPIHGIEEALGWRETRLGYVTLIGGILGLTLGFALQAWTHGVDWPLNIGGKTDLAIPAMGPVMFELTILIAAYLSVFAFFYRRGLKPRVSLKANLGQPGDRVNDDHFVILVVEQDGGFARTKFLKLCEELDSAEVKESWRIMK